ncbi:type II secretion system protein GspL [Thioalkalivibrio sp. ALMg11]|uniref:type II secretion system protein GspL n=1 Tax=Thioalkalivibrio sp. ALMg11 TaxID=1158165 RepID=UPI000376C292|nr:type II secretion system protein GspL [Thioalkalivibrio sp. ALMg11]
MNWFLFQLPEPEMLGADTPLRLRWLRLRRNGALADQGEAAPDELRTLLAADDHAVALLPGERAPLHRVFVPGKSGRVRRRALPFALEDRLSEDLEQLRIVAGPRHGSETLAGVVAQRDLECWEDWLHEHGIRVSHMIPDLALLRSQDLGGQVFLLSGTQRSIVLSPEAEPLAMPQEVASWWLQQRAALTTPPDDARTDEAQPPQNAVHVVDPAAEPDPRAPLQPPPGWSGDVLELLLVGVQSGELPPAELQRAVRSALAFDFASPAESPTAFGALPAPWRVPAALALVLAVIWLGSVWLEAGQLEREYRATEQDIAALFEETLPQARMVDPVAQFESVLGQGESGTTATVHSPLGEALARIMEGLAARDLTLQRLRGDHDRLELELEGSGIAELEQLREGLREAMNARVRIVSAETGEQGVRARMTIEKQP